MINYKPEWQTERVMKITKNHIAREAFLELIWSNRGWEDIDARKRMLAQAVWEEMFSDGGLFLNILFFRQYLSGFCAPRIARYKKVYKADIPAVVGGAELRSGEVEIASNHAEIVFAVNAASPCTLENFLAAAALLHESRNRQLVTVCGTADFIPTRHWQGIYAATGKMGNFIDDRSVEKILPALPGDARMLWTGGFFDDADICCSVIEKS